jgi:2-oxoglutarate dehydrogenase E2 component (dihydrolipoamide succinyltransferase)
MATEVKVPSVGESVSEIYVGKWYKSEGEAIAPDENLVELESDKATLDVPSPAGGVLTKILKQTGETAEVGEVIAQIDSADGAANVAAAQKPEPKAAAKPAAEPAPKPAQPSAQPPGDGAAKSGRAKPIIVREEAKPEPPTPAPQPIRQAAPVKAASVRTESTPIVERASSHRPRPEAPRQTAAPASTATPIPIDQRAEERVPLSPIRRRIAARLVEAQHNAALLTTFNEIDMTAVKELRAQFGESFQKRYGVKLGFMSFFVKAAIEALRQCPELNGMIENDHLVYRRYYDIGVAIGSDRGLVVPILRNAEQMSFAQVESAIEDLARRAQSGDLRVEELQGGTFTITNGGVYGSLLSTPIVNPPQSGVLGMHAIQDRPVAINHQVVIRPMMYVALTYDHRIVDGREAVTFLRRIKEAIESPARMLLEV